MKVKSYEKICPLSIRSGIIRIHMYHQREGGGGRKIRPEDHRLASPRLLPE